ncbi:hypothetical protein KCP69_19645 [Salmonella enterica subsp. enterica]|nr:hypothetical protein KCP69_19645 [Salmonella enterica subsp. enterica]
MSHHRRFSRASHRQVINLHFLPRHASSPSGPSWVTALTEHHMQQRGRWPDDEVRRRIAKATAFAVSQLLPTHLRADFGRPTLTQHALGSARQAGIGAASNTITQRGALNRRDTRTYADSPGAARICLSE